MPRCRKCSKDWPASVTVCPDDGYSFTVELDATMHPDLMATGGDGARAVAVATAPSPAPEPDDEQSTDLPPGMIVGEYRIEAKIGEGGMGAVYGAVHPMIGKKAAIKVISPALGADPSAVQRFIDEARSVNQIGHPNIVDVFGFGTLPDGRNYFAMEYLRGEGLANRIESATMSLGEAIEILDQVADALEAAHEKKIVHRDLKPDNVYLAAVRGGRTMVKLLDFGIAKLAVAEGGIAKTRTGMMMGTPGYISPEQARGKNVDHRTDIYALGCMMFEIACGQLPFIADNAMDIVLMHLTAAPPQPSELWSEIPKALEQLIMQTLDKNPDNRPSLAQIRAVFSELVDSGLVTIDNQRGVGFRSGVGRTPMGGVPIVRAPTSSALATSPPIAGEVAASPAPRKRTGLVLGAVAGVALLAGGGIFMATRGGDRDSAPPTAAQPPPAVARPAPPPQPAAPVAPVEVAKVVTPAPAPAAPAGGTIAIELADKNAKIEVDTKPVAWAGTLTTIPVDADGVHVVTVTSPGRVAYSHELEVSGGKTVALAVKLERAHGGHLAPASAVAPKATGDAAKPAPPTPTPPTVKKPDDGLVDPGI